MTLRRATAGDARAGEPSLLAPGGCRGAADAHLHASNGDEGVAIPGRTVGASALQAGLLASGRGRPQPRRGAVGPVLVLAVARARDPPGAPRAGPALRRGRAHHAPAAGPAARGGGGVGGGLHGQGARRAAGHRSAARPAARPDDADLGRVLLRARVRRALPAARARADRRQRERRRHRAQVLRPAAHGPAPPAHAFLVDRLEHGPEPQQPLPGGLSTRERALYLQGTFFNTAVVQMSEAMAHLLMVLAQHHDVQERAGRRARRRAPPRPRDRRDAAPVSAVRHRPPHHVRGHRGRRAHDPPRLRALLQLPRLPPNRLRRPGALRPERWESRSHRDAAFIPFGVAGNRPCPARGMAPITMRAAAREVLRRFALASSASHTRSIPNRGPCLLVARAARREPRLRRRLLLAFVRVRDRWEDVWRSLVQLVLGTYMVWDARRLRLCQRHFDAVRSALTRVAAAAPACRACRWRRPERRAPP